MLNLDRSEVQTIQIIDSYYGNNETLVKILEFFPNTSELIFLNEHCSGTFKFDIFTQIGIDQLKQLKTIKYWQQERELDASVLQHIANNITNLIRCELKTAKDDQILAPKNIDSIWLSILQNNKTLQVIDFCGILNESDIVEHIANCLPHMLQIKLEILNRHTENTLQTLTKLKNGCAHIELIVLNTVYLIATYIVDNKVATLQLNNCIHKTTAEIDHSVILNNIHQFTPLYINALQLINFKEYNTQKLQQLLLANTELFALEIWFSGVKTFTNEQILESFRTLPHKLKQFSIQAHTGLTTNTVNTILENNPQVTTFCFRSCSGVKIDELIRVSETDIHAC